MTEPNETIPDPLRWNYVARTGFVREDAEGRKVWIKKDGDHWKVEPYQKETIPLLTLEEAFDMSEKYLSLLGQPA